jgi:hypothetical protein
VEEDLLHYMEINGEMVDGWRTGNDLEANGRDLIEFSSLHLPRGIDETTPVEMWTQHLPNIG